jgi:heme-degrading monooxygenase HmoA
MPASTPQTMTTMEAGFTVNQENAEEFWRQQERMGPVAAAAPGFLAVIGGPIARSPWLYFCGKWQTPDLMDQWYHDAKHKPMMKAAHDRWFGACYIRKWRLRAEGEEISGPVFCETAIAGDVAAPAERIEALLDRIDREIAAHAAKPFETMTGQYERQPYQFVGPLQEFPQAAPVRYLLLTHWKSADDAQRWLQSPVMTALAELGTASSAIMVRITHRPGEREGLRADGSHREFGRPPHALAAE